MVNYRKFYALASLCTLLASPLHPLYASHQVTSTHQSSSEEWLSSFSDELLRAFNTGGAKAAVEHYKGSIDEHSTLASEHKDILKRFKGSWDALEKNLNSALAADRVKQMIEGMKNYYKPLSVSAASASATTTTPTTTSPSHSAATSTQQSARDYLPASFNANHKVYTKQISLGSQTPSYFANGSVWHLTNPSNSDPRSGLGYVFHITSNASKDTKIWYSCDRDGNLTWGWNNRETNKSLSEHPYSSGEDLHAIARAYVAAVSHLG